MESIVGNTEVLFATARKKGSAEKLNSLLVHWIRTQHVGFDLLRDDAGMGLLGVAARQGLYITQSRSVDLYAHLYLCEEVTGAFVQPLFTRGSGTCIL